MNPYGIRLTREEKVACVTFDRPGRQNALDETMWNDMERVLEDLRGNLPGAVVVTGAGAKAFCAGFDVQLDNPHARRFFEAIEGRDSHAIRLIIERIRSLTDALTLLPVPVIAAINGLAYGEVRRLPPAVTCGSWIRTRSSVSPRFVWASCPIMAVPLVSPVWSGRPGQRMSSSRPAAYQPRRPCPWGWSTGSAPRARPWKSPCPWPG